VKSVYIIGTKTDKSYLKPGLLLRDRTFNRV